MRIASKMVGYTRDWVVGHREPDLPSLRLSPTVAAKWAFDEWALQAEILRSRVRVPNMDFRRRLRNELGDAVDMYNERGWVDDPRSYHHTPPVLEHPELGPHDAWGMPFEHLSFESGFEPHEDEPGRDRWLGYEANATGHAWVLRHEGEPRPWLICINGYRTGSPAVDLWAFEAKRLHHKYGLNLAFPVQPLHGPRSVGMSGDRVLFGGAMNLIYTAAQGLWDIRRLKSWIQNDQKATAVGAFGLSLGGYFTALTACFEDDLACAIAGIPEPDLVRGMRRNVEPLLPPWYEQWGLSWRSLERANRVVSPLAMDPVIDVDKRFIFAGLADRWVRPGNVKTLWEHWDQPEILWYQGAHLSFAFEPSVRRFIDDALHSTVLSGFEPHREPEGQPT